MKLLTKISICLAALLTPVIACADLLYNPEHSAAMKNLQAIESATVTMQYECGKSALIISAYATQSEVSGRRATVTGKIVTEKTSHNISEQLTKSISRHDVLTGQMSVACNGDKGAFQIIVTPNKYAPKNANRAIISIFWDGTVNVLRF